MMRLIAFTLAFVIAALTGGGVAQAALVTPDVIFGSGNANGGFTVIQNNGVELGLRGKLRYDLSGQPQNVFNYNGIDTYSFNPADGNPPANRSMWSFDWSINTNFDGTSGLVLSDLTFQLDVDFDPGAGFGGLSFDPINVLFADHSFGTNATGNGAGVEAVDAIQYASLIATNNVAQNSSNLGFFLGLVPPFDPQASGIYSIGLSAFRSGDLIAATNINVVVSAVPLPASLPLFLAGLGALALVSRTPRRNCKAPAYQS